MKAGSDSVPVPRLIGIGSFGIPAGRWRRAALCFVLVALAGAGLALASPPATGWIGFILVAGIGAVASLFLYALWPSPFSSAIRAKGIAEAAAFANVAWAITNSDGSVLECNDAYRHLAGGISGSSVPPPELAFATESSAAALYRLTRAAAAQEQAEETITTGNGFQILAVIRPMRARKTAWWFAPQIPARTESSTSAEAKPLPIPPPSFLKDAPFGIAIADSQGRLIETNDAFVQFFGRRCDGTLLPELIDAPGRANVAGAIAQALRGVPAGMTELRPADNADRMAELHARKLDGGGEARVILFLADVSEQKALETRFAQSQKMQAVGQLAGGVAHDFNNLLTVIIGNSEFLLMRHTAGDPSFKEINEIHQNALRAATLVGQLLAFSRKQTLQPRVLVLRDVIGELALMLRRLLREGIELKLEHGADLWPVNADETQISNAIINLVVNARDAMPKGGVVTIATANECVSQPAVLGSGVMPPGDYVRIDVRDTGIGIAREHLDKIFDPFFTTKPVGQGTGLGLATVYGIIKQTGGFITVDSESGRGTTFHIFLPRHKVEQTVPVQVEPPPPRDITGEDTVLLVEDEEAVRSFAARALKLRGYNVLEASGGEEALDLVKRHAGAIHLLITDVVMPNMDGPTLARAVRRLRPEMAVIFMSGYAEEAFRRNEEKAEDLHFLAKPFGLKQLAAKVKEVLSGSPAPKRAAKGD